jgi:hypothetical protein
MICYECHHEGKTRDAVALCHHCSAALCPEHALILIDPVTAQYPICKTVVLPLRARVFLCSTCHEALRQTIDDSREGSEEGDGANKTSEQNPELQRGDRSA